MDINLSTLVTGREVSLKDMLDAREHRQEVQRMLLSEHHLPVISFTLNIVGPSRYFLWLCGPFTKASASLKPSAMHGKSPLLPPIPPHPIRDMSISGQ